MCLSVPGKVIKIENDVATIDYSGEIRLASLALLPHVRIGEYVLVSAKMIMQTVPEKEALATLALWDETDRYPQ